MNVIPGGMKRRSTFGSALIGLGLAITSVGFLATAPSASAAQDPDMHCANHTTEDKWNVPEGGGSITMVVDGVPVTVTVTGGSVSFTDAEGDPLVVDYCLKAGTNNTGKKQGSSGNTDSIPNNGGNAPDISYVLIYSVPGPSTPETSPTSPETSPTSPETSPTSPETSPTSPETSTTATVLPTESTVPTEPAESESTTTPTVLPTVSTAPVDPETSTTPTVLPSSRTSSPAMAPTAVDAGLAGDTGEQGVPSSLLILFGAALAVLGLGIGFVPVVARGKHSH